MKVYYLMQLLGGMQSSGTAEIIKYHQIPGGWHAEIRDPQNGQIYELNIIPRESDEVKAKVKHAMEKFDDLLSKIRNMN